MFKKAYTHYTEALDRNKWIFNVVFGSVKSRVIIWFFEMSKASPVSIWNDFTPNVATEALDRNSWILDADLWFQFKVKWKYDFFEILKANPVPVSIRKEFTSKNMAAEALDRSSWILDVDHWFSSKSRENCLVFLKL